MKITIDFEEIWSNVQDYYGWYIAAGTIIWYMGAGLVCRFSYGSDVFKKGGSEEYFFGWLCSPVLALFIAVVFTASVLFWTISLGYIPLIWTIEDKKE